MLAAFIEQTGPPEVVSIGDLPSRRPRLAQALAHLSAAPGNNVISLIESLHLKQI
jgi:hypothetical protein